MSEVTTEIIETGPIEDTPSAVSTEGLAAELSAELAAEEAAKAEAKERAAEKVEAKAAKKEAPSIDDALEKALAKAKGETPEAKEDAKEEKPKAQRSPDGKFAVPEKDGKAGGKEPEDPSSEGEFLKIPSRLLPSEREHWNNVPHSVKRAVHRWESEMADMESRSSESVKFHEELREFDGMAKAANTTVKEALGRYVEFDKEIAADFGKGVSTIMKNFGKNPTEAVAQIMRASGVTPQQLGAYLSGNPAQPQPQAQQQRQSDPVAQAALQKIEQLEAKLAQQEQEAQRQAVTRSIQESVVNPAKESMPRMDELQPYIVKMLETGYIEFSLSPEVRLREAYFAADRMYPALQKAIEEAADLDVDSKVATLPRKKQISGSPSASASKITPKGPAPSIDDALEAAFRRASKR